MTSPALRDNLRLAATVTVVNGFANLTGLPFALYASLAVLSVTVGNYGNTIELGRQRLVGTAIGGIVVFFGYRAWGQLPLVVALPLALLLARLIAGSLRLTVGYGVCCFVVVMGWLTHEQQLDSWIPLRLLWTAFGILMALLSLRLFWPSRARIQQREGLLQLLVDLGHTLLQVVQHPPTAIQSQAQRRRQLGQQIRSLRINLQGLRVQRQSALLELGTLASAHPVARMWALLDQASEALILDLDELGRLRRRPGFCAGCGRAFAELATATERFNPVAATAEPTAFDAVLGGPAVARIKCCLQAAKPRATATGGRSVDGAQSHGSHHGEHRTPMARACELRVQAFGRDDHQRSTRYSSTTTNTTSQNHSSGGLALNRISSSTTSLTSQGNSCRSRGLRIRGRGGDFTEELMERCWAGARRVGSSAGRSKGCGSRR
jgi:hypothetical protein